jgi:hypothetical protein
MYDETKAYIVSKYLTFDFLDTNFDDSSYSKSGCTLIVITWTKSVAKRTRERGAVPRCIKMCSTFNIVTNMALERCTTLSLESSLRGKIKKKVLIMGS